MSHTMNRSASLYFTEIAKTPPVIDAQGERRLIERWQRHRDFRARDTLVKCHLRFVVTVARKHSKDADRLPDLIAAGNLGLLKALDRFDLDRTPQTRFLTYAGWWIHKEVADEDYATSSLVYVPPHRKKAQRRQARAFQKALHEHGPEAPCVRSMDPGVPEGMAFPLDGGAGEPEFDDVNSTDDDFESASTNSLLRRAIGDLPMREQTVLNLHFGLKDDPRSLAQIAAILEIHPERVRQIKVSGMERLRAALEDHALSATDDAY
jgi:RNA polymerase sigma factor (sigma-70 family)